jgi:hypothetical protein
VFVSELVPGAALGGYRIMERVCGSATGTVYRASQPALDRNVLLHVASAAEGSPEAARFIAEARALAAVRHPSVPAVYEAGYLDGLLFASMQHALGRPLAEVVNEGPIPPERAVALIEQIVGGTEALLQAGEQARLAPESVLVQQENATLLPLLLAPGEGAAPTSASVAALLKSLVGERPGRLEKVLRAPTRFGSSMELAEAARAALAAPRRGTRRRRWPAFAALGGVAALTAVGLAVRHDEQGAPERASTNAPSARIVATIPVGGEPGSVAFYDGSLWVATFQRRLVRVDARTNQVVGTPLRFSSGKGDSNMTVRAGDGAVYVSDGAAGVLVRVDARTGRISKRVRLAGAIDSLLPAGSRVWISRSLSTQALRRSEVVPLDARTLAPVGDGVGVGSGPLDLEADGNAVLVSGAGDGTITRVEPGRRPRRRLVNGQAMDSALAAGKLWVPSPSDGGLTVIDPSLARPPLRTLHLGIVANATALGDALWIVRKDGIDPTSSSSLLRLDPESERVVGRPLKLGETGWPQPGGDSLWFGAASRRAVLRVSATRRRPLPRAPERAPEGLLQSGPLLPGRVSADRGGVTVSLAATDRSWVGLVRRENVELRRSEDRLTALTVTTPEVLLDEKGGAKPARTAEQVERHLRTHAFLNIARRVSRRVGGLPAHTYAVRLSRRAPPAPFCPARCAPVYGTGNFTGGVESGSTVEISVLEISEKPVLVVAEWATARGAVLARRLRDTLKLTAAR